MVSSDIVVTRVESKADLKAFIDLPKRLYAGHKGYTPHLNTERLSKPQTSRPTSSLTDRLNGPVTRFMPLDRSQSSAAANRAAKIAGSSSAARQPKWPVASA